MDLTQEECLKLWHYKDGVLYWNDPSCHKNKNGITTKHNLGYIAVRYKNTSLLAHRIIYILHYGAIPINTEVDHINHIKNDNRIENLRIISRNDNMKNLPRYKTNTTGFNGVYVQKDKYTRKNKIYNYQSFRAFIIVDNKKIHLGRFKTLEEAIEARKQANIKYGFHENHGL